MDKELMISKDIKSSKNKDPGKHKCFICHNKRYFAKECPKSRIAKREEPASKINMACHKDLNDSHPAAEDRSVRKEKNI